MFEEIDFWIHEIPQTFCKNENKSKNKFLFKNKYNLILKLITRHESNDSFDDEIPFCKSNTFQWILRLVLEKKLIMKSNIQFRT